MIFRIALRNAFRNKRRTTLSLLIIALGTGLLFTLGAFVTFINTAMRDGTVEYVGSLQIADTGFWNQNSAVKETVISPDEREELEQLLREVPGVRQVAGQIEVQAQLQYGRASQIVYGVAVEPDRAVFSAYQVAQGAPLAPGDRGNLLVGESLAMAYGIEVGDYVTLLASTIAGAFNTARLQVTGLIRMSTETDEAFTVVFSTTTAQDLLRMRGVNKLVVALDDLDEAGRVAALLSEPIQRIRSTFSPRTWDQLSPEFLQTRSLFQFILGSVSLAIFVLVFFVILEVLTMSFLERTREIGTIRAIGTQRSQVFRQLIAESVLLALLGALGGAVIGIGLSTAINAAGVLWHVPGEIEPTLIRVILSPAGFVLPLCMALVSTLVSAVFPAVRTTRRSVVDALRTT